MRTARAVNAARYLVAIPDLAQAPWVEEFRRQHDPLHGRIAAHVTLVFGDMPDDAATRAACAAVAARHLPLAARIDTATAAPDEYRGGWFLSLSGWPGTAFAALHGDLARCIRASPHAGYEPHITLGRFAGEDAARAARRRLDALMRPFDIRIDALWVVARDGERLSAPVRLV